VALSAPDTMAPSPSDWAVRTYLRTFFSPWGIGTPPGTKGILRDNEKRNLAKFRFGQKNTYANKAQTGAESSCLGKANGHTCRRALPQHRMLL
jgi:hypothetical protein